MEVVLTEWASALIRWTHVIAGIAWIGSSFYFIHLDLSLRPRAGLPPGVKGEAWQVHGGGFYHMVKYLVAPPNLPDHLTWFKWEAYATWLSGFGLLVVVYYFNAEMFLVDRSVLDLSPNAAIAMSLGMLLVPWLAYEIACRSPLGKSEIALALVGYVFLVGVTYAYTQIFSGRGAFVQIGALVGTIMVANVFVVIIPNQKKIVAAMLGGTDPNPAWGEVGKQRSVHNNYLTLPVVFLMISTHYPLMFATRYNWIIVAILLLMGPAIRHFYNRRHEGKEGPLWTWAAAAVGALVIVWLSAMGTPGVKVGEGPAPKFAAVQEIVTSRCSMCHASEPVWSGIVFPPKAIRLDTADNIRGHRHEIEIQAVRSNAMPPGNITGMTVDERSIVAAWLAAGAAKD